MIKFTDNGQDDKSLPLFMPGKLKVMNIIVYRPVVDSACIILRVPTSYARIGLHMRSLFTCLYHILCIYRVSCRCLIYAVVLSIFCYILLHMIFSLYVSQTVQ